jgi:uncharacterized protein YqhQ
MVSTQPPDRAPRKAWFSIVAAALVAFVAYEGLQGKIVTIIVLVPLLVSLSYCSFNDDRGRVQVTRELSVASG